jgi:hypothetical protein
MKWVTRKRIQVNRAATAWLVRRFIDPQAEFIFVDPEQVAAFQDREAQRDSTHRAPLPSSGFPGPLLVRGASSTSTARTIRRWWSWRSSSTARI